MRVTKVISQYVDEKVHDAYYKRTNPFAEAAELDRQKIAAFNAELNRKAKEEVDAFLKELPVYHQVYENTKTVQKPTKYEEKTFFFGKTENMTAELEWKIDNLKQAKEKVKEILINLELGGTRQELDDMLSALGVEE